MATTIQVSHGLLTALKERKILASESYEEIIWDLLEDTMELSEETKVHILQSEEDIKAGKVFTLNQARKELGL